MVSYAQVLETTNGNSPEQSNKCIKILKCALSIIISAWNHTFGKLLKLLAVESYQTNIILVSSFVHTLLTYILCIFVMNFSKPYYLISATFSVIVSLLFMNYNLKNYKRFWPVYYIGQGIISIFKVLFILNIFFEKSFYFLDLKFKEGKHTNCGPCSHILVIQIICVILITLFKIFRKIENYQLNLVANYGIMLTFISLHLFYYIYDMVTSAYALFTMMGSVFLGLSIFFVHSKRLSKLAILNIYTS